MLNAGTLQGRLTLSTAAVLIAGLVAFAVVAVAVFDRAQRSALDAQLGTSARAVAAIVEASGRDSIVLDVADRAQFGRIIGARAASAVFDAAGRRVIASIAAVPARVDALAVHATETTLATVQDAEGALRVVAEPIRRGGRRVGVVAVWRDASAIDALDRAVALRFALGIPVIVALAVLFAGALARRGLAPLERIAALASEIEAHDLSARLALPSRDDELGRLTATFDRMLDRLERAFQRERRFVADASHELRAPLSVIRAEADLALRRERQPDEYRRALSAIAFEADALEALTRDLLALARAESGGDAPVTERVECVALLRSTVARLEPLAVARGIAIALDAAEDAHVRGESSALERALITVVHNALKYARDGGRVDVRVARDGGEVVLGVDDDGPGFSVDARQHAFDRFWRDDASRALPGSGLGLAIARETVERYGGSIAIGDAPGGGAAVSIRLPAT